MISFASAGRATMLRRAAQRQNPHQHLNISRRAHSSKPGHDSSTTTTTNGAPTSPSSNGAGAGTTQTNTATAQTIPIPGNSWLEPFQVPLRHYLNMNRRRPYVTQLLSTLTIWLLGDLSAQYITSTPAILVSDAQSKEAKEDGGEELIKTSGGFRESYDPKRTARALVIGGLASIPSYRWLIWLGENFNWRSKVLSISFKVVFNQLTFTPVFNVYFFSMQTILTGLSNGQPASVDDVVERVKHTVPASWMNSWKVWPAVTFFSFWAVPVDLRNVFAGVIAIGWQTYLGILNQRAAREESVSAAVTMDKVEGVGKRRQVSDGTATAPAACSKERATA